MIGRVSEEQLKFIDSLDSGDLIRFTKGRSILEVSVQISGGSACIRIPGSRSEQVVASLLIEGFSVELVSKADHAVPTEPGLYAPEDGEVGDFLYLYNPYPDTMDGAFWMTMGSSNRYAHTDLPYTYLPLRLIELASED
ncbi:hypothetical protein SEA_BIG4_261 [Microbacterium phage Big4]|nr:hypothetical protein SEA_BIG4_261 [Microbacterium phage Big4]